MARRAPQLRQLPAVEGIGRQHGADNTGGKNSKCGCAKCRNRSDHEGTAGLAHIGPLFRYEVSNATGSAAASAARTRCILISGSIAPLEYQAIARANEGAT